ncbi:TRAP transporter large permease [Oceaniovalibus sp. ACAM 378]|jgi:tripartite ATP-independent transporter DctM subunit|uniref:TRAP transporter large permease n=1 Tax=Oceaniovalibus sp. ACAM 378 TaxID=2599923 RepID=UPI0011D41DD9|nr:TRAP transporter large permease [Oceaniovalibus sp. ACAM 378]TYB89450.1 TRAP transporter large permease [Oceaniovalibus sp. ACAM 378]
MDFFTIVGIGAIVAFLALLLLGMHLAVTFLLVGFGGVAILLNSKAALSLVGETMYSAIATPTYTVLPLFVLMGAFAAASGFAEQAYKSIHKVAAGIPGSLAIATSFGSAAFATICGSSLATASVFGRIAYPEMRRYGYDRSFALGSIACSGTFASMIPPSGMFILFAIFTETSVGRLFMAGIVPGVITATVYAISMYWRAKTNPALAPMLDEEKSVTPVQRVRALGGLWQIALLGTIVIGGMYAGFFTATEAGAIGAIGTLVFGLANGPLRHFETFRGALRESAEITAMLFFIIVGALFFSRFLGLSRIPYHLTLFLESWEVHRHFILALILLTWFVLGMLIVQTAVFALTLPILFPIVVNLGYDPIWFCVIAMKMNEIAGVTPPVGLNAFSLAGSAGKDVRVEHVYKGVMPFILCDLVVLILLIAVPGIVTFLPNMMFN